jgi:NADH:ubiquinone oxidoreductase subunit C
MTKILTDLCVLKDFPLRKDFPLLGFYENTL